MRHNRPQQSLPPKTELFNLEQQFVPSVKQYTHPSLPEQVQSKSLLKKRSISLKATWSAELAPPGHKGDSIFTLWTKRYQSPFPILLFPGLVQVLQTNKPTEKAHFGILEDNSAVKLIATFYLAFLYLGPNPILVKISSHSSIGNRAKTNREVHIPPKPFSAIAFPLFYWVSLPSRALSRQSSDLMFLLGFILSPTSRNLWLNWQPICCT